MLKNIDLYYSDVNLLNDMLNFYYLTKYTCYPFMPVKLGFAIYKSNIPYEYEFRVRTAYFLSFLHYHVLPFYFIADSFLAGIGGSLLEDRSFGYELKQIKCNYL